MNPNLDNPKRIDSVDAMEGGKLFPLTHGLSIGMLPNISLSTESDTTRSLGRRISAPSTKYHDSNWSSSSGSSSNSFDGAAGNNNKFLVFSKLEKTNEGKGGERKILGTTSSMSLSNEIRSSVDSDDDETENAILKNILRIKGEPTSRRAGRNTWGKSQSQFFVRNFP